jgi:multidrug efflux pump subunit AcrB
VNVSEVFIRRPIAPNDQPILMLNLTSNTLPLSALDDCAEPMIAPRMQTAITLQVMRQPGSNTIEVTDAVHGDCMSKSEISNLKSEIPGVRP